VASGSNNDPRTDVRAPRGGKRERRSSSVPAPAEVAAEAAAIYPDTFDTPPSPAEIAAEAYAIYLARGGEDGRDRDDWLEAERRLNALRTSRR
jgi:hypothetical protein